MKLRADFPNTNRALFPNQFVNARLLEQEKTGVTLLASAAIQRNTNETYVYFIKPDNTVTIRNIKAWGQRKAINRRLRQGYRPATKVVMTGVDKLQEGSKVAPSADKAKSERNAVKAGQL